MRNTPVLGHALRVVPADAAPVAQEEKPKLHLGLTWLDRMPLDALVSDDATNLVDEVRLSAEALAGDQGDAARLRSVSRLLSVTRAQVILLETMLNQRLAKRDYDAVAVIDRALGGASRRLALLLSEHRASCAAGRRTSVVVAVGNAEHVTVRSGP